MAGSKDRPWTWDEQALAIWRFRQKDHGYGALPVTLRELAHLYQVPEIAVRKLFHRINYLERLAPDDGQYINGPRKYDLRAVWEHYRDKPEDLNEVASALQTKLLAERGAVPVRKQVEFGKARPRR